MHVMRRFRDARSEFKSKSGLGETWSVAALLCTIGRYLFALLYLARPRISFNTVTLLSKETNIARCHKISNHHEGARIGYNLGNSAVKFELIHRLV